MYHLLHPGITEYHHIGLIIPLLASISPMFLSRLFSDSNLPQVVKALAFGGIVSSVSYIIFQYAPVLYQETYAINKAILLGLLVSEMTIFSASDKVPSIVLISLFLFLYTFALSKMPDTHH